jgi:hypothetical protein
MKRLVSIFEHQSDAVREFIPVAGIMPEHRAAIAALESHTGKETAAVMVMRNMEEMMGVCVLAPYVMKSGRVLVLTPDKDCSRAVKDAFCGTTLDPSSAFMVRSGVIPGNKFFSALHPPYTVANSVSDMWSANSLVIKVCDDAIADQYPRDHYELIVVMCADQMPYAYWKFFLHHFPSSLRVILTKEAPVDVPVCYNSRVESE